MGQRGVVRLGTDGVEFPENLLAKEVQWPSGGGGRIAQGAELVKVGGKARGLLGNVAFVRKQGHFPDDALVIRRDGKVRFRQALEHGFPQPDGNGRGVFRDLVPVLFQGFQLAEHIRLQVGALRRAHGEEIFQGRPEGLFHRRPCFLRGKRGFRLGGDDVQPQQVGRLQRHGPGRQIGGAVQQPH